MPHDGAVKDKVTLTDNGDNAWNLATLNGTRQKTIDFRKIV
ncbi:hypothetical protein EMQ_2938 [Acetobacter aceti NBRC 14818]|uniref:Uncharacterized protein n=1 Tax=Acetobacter aceti NBRC 14818 TaxID=887700 RepID=A0AB33IHD8_ACEAC|nr:hypothetical protein EMQ_2938 [Acetobacter aceti NBRC 14818]GAN58981.1 hypothetical protein Abac_217_013 [Acetobacter aceti NBRC 14818]